MNFSLGVDAGKVIEKTALSLVIFSESGESCRRFPVGLSGSLFDFQYAVLNDHKNGILAMRIEAGVAGKGAERWQYGLIGPKIKTRQPEVLAALAVEDDSGVQMPGQVVITLDGRCKGIMAQHERIAKEGLIQQGKAG